MRCEPETFVQISEEEEAALFMRRLGGEKLNCGGLLYNLMANDPATGAEDEAFVLVCELTMVLYEALEMGRGWMMVGGIAKQPEGSISPVEAVHSSMRHLHLYCHISEDMAIRPEQYLPSLIALTGISLLRRRRRFFRAVH